MKARPAPSSSFFFNAALAVKINITNYFKFTTLIPGTRYYAAWLIQFILTPGTIIFFLLIELGCAQ